MSPTVGKGSQDVSFIFVSSAYKPSTHLQSKFIKAIISKILDGRFESYVSLVSSDFLKDDIVFWLFISSLTALLFLVKGYYFLQRQHDDDCNIAL